MNELREKFPSAIAWLRSVRHMGALALAGVGIGAAAALVEVIFVKGLQVCDALFSSSLWWLAAMPFLGLLIVWMFSRFWRFSRAGLALVFEVDQKLARWIPKRTPVLMISATWLSHLAGASVGKEGVGMLAGACMADLAARLFSWLETDATVFLTAGMAAGFAGLFQTPLTACFFAMEVLVSGSIKYKAMPCTLSAAFSACWIASLFGLKRELYVLPAMSMPVIDGWGWASLLVMGAAFGAAGCLFAWSEHFFKHKMAHLISNPYSRIFFGGIALAVCMLIFGQGRYSSGGENLIFAALNGQTVYSWDFALKAALTVAALSIGFVGGEVTPLFAIGATLGAVLGPVFSIPAPAGAALGFAAVFSAGTNTWLAAMMVGMEMFGYSLFPFFFAVCSMAFLVNRNVSIYKMQRNAEDLQKLAEKSSPGLDWIE